MTQLWLFSLFWCVTSIPVQFVYRYFLIVREQTISKLQYILFLSIAIFGALSIATFNTYIIWPNENLLNEKRLLLEADIYYFRGVPMFLVTEIQRWSMKFAAGYVIFLVTASYSICIITSYKVWMKLKTHFFICSAQTRRMHNQMTKTMILQVIKTLHKRYLGCTGLSSGSGLSQCI